MNTQGDTRFIVGTVLAIVAVGLLIAGGLWLALRAGSPQPKCSGRIVVGIAASVRESVRDSPVHNQFTERCDYWAAVHNGELLAIRTTVPGRTCAVRWLDRLNSFVCGEATLAWSALEYWPAREVDRPQQPGAWEIDFGPG